MKKKFYKYILLILLMILCLPSFVSAEEKIKQTDLSNVKTSVKDLKEHAQQDKNYPVINAFQANDEQKNTTLTVQGGIATNAIMSLDEAIKLALANNPAIMSAIANTEIYKTKIGQAWSNYFPSLSAGIGYSREKSLTPSGTVYNTQAYNYFNTVSVGASQLLFDFGKTKARADIAQKTFKATQDNLQETINETIYAVKSAYYDLLFSIQKEAVYEDTVSRYEVHLKQAQAYYDLGVKPKIDVITAEYNLSNAKLGHIQAKNQIDIAMANLNNAMGLPEFANYSIDEKIKLKKYDYNFDNLIVKAYDVRPELLAAQKKAEASKLLVRATKREFTPDLNIAAEYKLGGTNPAQDYGYSFGGNLSYPVTNLMYLKKQVDEAKATSNKDSADYQKTKQDVYLAVKNSYLTLYESELALPVTKNAMKQAQEQYELASGRYKVGAGEIIELKDAENTYRSAQLEYYRAILKYNTALAHLEKVVGVPIEQITKIIENTDL